MSGSADWWVPIASLAMGVFAYLLSRVLHDTLLAHRAPRDHRRYRERILDRLHYLLNLQAEVADVEQELVELWKEAPDKQALLIADTAARAHTMPRALLRLAERFGFDVPSEAALAEAAPRDDTTNAKPAQPSVYPSREPAGNVIAPAAWTGRMVAR